MSRPSLILVHGFRGAPAGLEPIAIELRSAGFEVFVPPIPPFAGAKPLHEYTPVSYADFLADFARTHHLDHPILIGHSMGSLVATAAASHHPEAFHDDLILLSPISNKPARVFAMLAPLSAYLPRRLVDFTTTCYLYAGHHQLKSVLRDTNTCSRSHTCSRKEAMIAADFSAHYCVADFDIPKNVHIIAGTTDRLIPKKSTDALASKLKITPVYLTHTGHLHNYEKPQETAQEILRILENAASSATFRPLK